MCPNILTMTEQFYQILSDGRVFVDFGPVTMAMMASKNGVIQTGFEHGTLAAAMALRILSGERASDMPIMTTVQGLTMINLKTANKLRIEIPEHLLQEAAAIVE